MLISIGKQLGNPRSQSVTCTLHMLLLLQSFWQTVISSIAKINICSNRREGLKSTDRLIMAVPLLCLFMHSTQVRQTDSENYQIHYAMAVECRMQLHWILHHEVLSVAKVLNKLLQYW